jgi:hypothetical protein
MASIITSPPTPSTECGQASSPPTVFHTKTITQWLLFGTALEPRETTLAPMKPHAKSKFFSEISGCPPFFQTLSHGDDRLYGRLEFTA